MEDAVTGVEVTLQYGVLPDYDVITRSAEDRLSWRRKDMYQESAVCMSGFCSGKYDLLTFYGRHAMERTMQRDRSHMEVM